MTIMTKIMIILACFLLLGCGKVTTYEYTVTYRDLNNNLHVKTFEYASVEPLTWSITTAYGGYVMTACCKDYSVLPVTKVAGVVSIESQSYKFVE